ncbi:MAG: SUMF1/EgtB/PvdO family nonheme iron enzyme [Flavobacteriales bacterium]|jgi:Uncharacterized conserved protein|nr:SUMF1/EgtB/PvdO family nonheme iron enzyme [Flavobacteriales bacterium]MCA0390364.1 SUMF1/EgtB/PvdO family nonheme iron enzyme [Bacteroidota bacterium]
MKTRSLLVKALFSAVFSLMAIVTAKANNLQITGTSVSGNNITFNISWENSWNASAAPANWDAVWVFVKYQDCNTKLWAHADLSSTASDHTAASPLQVDPVTDGKGVFIRRSAVGGGNISSTSITLKMSSVSGTSNNYKVYGIEMVNIPQGSFQLGDGVSSYSFNSITVDANAQNNGLTTSQLGSYTADISPAFPMGYNSFYMMKYEISQEQYADFLNSLTFTQQKNRVVTDPISAAGSFAMYTGYQFRNGLAIVTPGSNGAIPAVFGCDATTGTPNASNDGQNIAMNGLSWADLVSYLDWAALRPMTEMEFEKACRGPLPRIDQEYPWGSTQITAANSGALSNAKLNSEVSSTTVNNGMCVYLVPTNSNTYGPLRVGNFANGSSGRLSAGAGYYGAMDLGGNVAERVIAVNAGGASFDGTMGDGNLTSTGFADVPSWPVSAGSITKGGSYLDGANDVRTSDRSSLYSTAETRTYTNGGRGVR